MIARIWTARTTRDRSAGYGDHLRAHVLPGLKKIEGFAEAMLLTRATSDGVELQVITLWRSLEAIRAFSGADVEAAVVTESAAALLTDYDRCARHFEVVLRET